MTGASQYMGDVMETLVSHGSLESAIKGVPSGRKSHTSHIKTPSVSQWWRGGESLTHGRHPCLTRSRNRIMRLMFVS